MEWTPSSAQELATELTLPLEVRWRHVVGAAGRAGSLTSDPMCLMAAWLHDIGYADQLHRTGMHAVDGAMYLDLMGAPRE